MVGCGTQSSDVDGRNSETEIISEINTQQETVNIENETEEENMKEEELYYMPEDYVTRRNDTEYGLLETVEYESTTTGTTRKANIILPAGYEEGKEYPVLLKILHNRTVFQKQI